MARYLWRKGMVFGIVLMLFFVAVHVPAIGQTTVIVDDVIPTNLFGLRSIINVNWDGNIEPLEPGGAPQIIPLNVTFVIVRDLFAKFILSYYSRTCQYITVTLEIEDKSNWCNASLSDSQLRFRIIDNVSWQYTFLEITVNEYAPAYKLGFVNITASVEDKYGPFGLLPLIEGYNRPFTIIFVPGYRGHVHATPEYLWLEQSPGNRTVISITVKNLGNAKTTVLADVNDTLIPKDWMMIITSQVDLEVNETKVMNLSFRSPMDFSGIAIFVLKFTPCQSSNFMNKGFPVFTTIIIEGKP